MSSPRRSSPRRKDSPTRGKRTGVTIPPRGAIPLNDDGYEDLDAFWDAAKSPHPNKTAIDDDDGATRQQRRREERQAEKARQLSALQAETAAALSKQHPALADAEKDVALKKKYGLSTPKNVTQWSNRLLHKAMGIPTEESPGTVLSKVSTAPPSARTTASDAEGVDPPDDSEEEEFSEVDATSGLLNAKSSDRTPAMENSMEEMVGTYDDEYDEGGGGGFELNTQGEVGFENDYDHFEEEEPVPTTGEEKPRGPSKNDKKPITPTSVLRTKKTKKKKNETNRVNWSTPNGTTGYPSGNREYEIIPGSTFKGAPKEGEENLRRSTRKRFEPLKYWKNEKLIYGAQNESGILGEAMGDMPVVKDVQRALPTPHKERPKRETKKEEEKPKKQKRKVEGSDDEGEEGPRARVPFDPTQLMKKRKIASGEYGTVWSEAMEDTTELKLVSRLDNRSFSKLPLSTLRSKKESKVVGFASQAFHVQTDPDDLFPGYISGNVVLPPKGIKDAEGVGLCSQVFNVGDCQPNSVEFALADPSSADGEFDPKTAQRFLLSKGDMFQIPPGNVYRIENHSKTDEARLFWTIIKCTSRAEQESDEE